MLLCDQKEGTKEKEIKIRKKEGKKKREEERKEGKKEEGKKRGSFLHPQITSGAL